MCSTLDVILTLVVLLVLHFGLLVVHLVVAREAGRKRKLSIHPPIIQKPTLD